MTAQRPVAPPFRLDDHVFYLFGQIFGWRNRALNTDLKPFGLDYQRWRVLAVLNEHPGCSMRRLAELTAVDRTTLTHTLARMAGQGLVERGRRAQDRRTATLNLSAEGRRLFRRILPLVVAHNARALDGFSTVEADDLRRQLHRMIANLRD